MKSRYPLYFIILFCLCACTTQPSYIKRPFPPPGTKTIVLPKGEEGGSPPSYEVFGKRYYPLPSSHGFVQYGEASWYGPKFHGRRTSSGEVYDMHKKTAAHKTLPLGTFVQVTNLVNRKTTIVRINDRGPFVKGREIDLSYAAAKDVGLIGPGVVRAKIVALAEEVGRLRTKGESVPLVEVEDFNRGDFTIQVGAFRDKNNALKLADRLKVIYGYVNIALFEDQDGQTYYRVRVSKSQSLIQAGEIEKRLEDMGLAGAFIVRI